MKVLIATFNLHIWKFNWGIQGEIILENVATGCVRPKFCVLNLHHQISNLVISGDDTRGGLAPKFKHTYNKRGSTDNMTCPWKPTLSHTLWFVDTSVREELWVEEWKLVSCLLMWTDASISSNVFLGNVMVLSRSYCIWTIRTSSSAKVVLETMLCLCINSFETSQSTSKASEMPQASDETES